MQMSTAVVEPYNSVLTTHASMDHSSVTFLGTGHRVRKSAQLYVVFDFWAILCYKYALMSQSNVTFYDTGRIIRRKQHFYDVFDFCAILC